MLQPALYNIFKTFIILKIYKNHPFTFYTQIHFSFFKDQGKSLSVFSVGKRNGSRVICIVSTITY